MAGEEATQHPQEDMKPDIKSELQHLTLTVVHQVSHGAITCTKWAKASALPPGSQCGKYAIAFLLRI
jgi:hypothetical protein